MLTDPIESELSDTERQALAICGIYKAEQLSEIRLETLLHDAELARSSFPDEMAALSSERLKAIHGAFAASVTTAAAPAPDDTLAPDNLPVPDKDQFDSRLPQLVLTRGGRKRKKKTPPSEKHKELHDKQHCIHSTRPLQVYISAWLTVLLYVDILAWFIIPPLMIVGIIPEFNAKLVIIGLILPAVPYFTTARKTRCSVCRLNIYTLRSYTKNRYAHNFLLLGTPLSTALHVIFCFWFRCPSCGTPQHLLRKRHNGR